jgi:hypothetical protein
MQMRSWMVGTAVLVALILAPWAVQAQTTDRSERGGRRPGAVLPGVTVTIASPSPWWD